jgi:Cof subfamily protein (haloacid dehalogenase superfamily)
LIGGEFVDRRGYRGRVTTSASTAHLVALDVDGTVVDVDERLSDAVRDTVAEVVAAGHHVVLATGRSLAATLPVLQRLDLRHGYAVCSNGAVTLALDPAVPEGYRVVDTVTFDPTEALLLLRRHLPTAAYAVEDVTSAFRLHGPFPADELVGEMTYVDFEDLLHSPATRVVVRSTAHSAQDFVELVQRVGLQGVSYAVGWTAWLDLAPQGVSKASALETVRARLGVDRRRTLAVGDGRNDLEMLAWAARGVAMGQAPPEVRSAADAVTGAVTDDGLVGVLEDLLSVEGRRAG